MTPTPIYDLLLSVVGPEAQASSPGRLPYRGGEWDAWRALTKRQRRILIGAGWARPGALRPDVLADYIMARRGFDTYDEALSWFYRTALLATAERRSAAQRDARERLARAGGYASYYHHRNAAARSAGYGGLWHYRKEMGWESNRPTPWRPSAAA